MREPTNYRQQGIFIVILVSLVSLFVSRAALSISMFTFIGLTCIHKELRHQYFIFLITPMLWGMSLLFILPFITGLWSHDLGEWWDMLRMKLPLLLFPFAFAGNWKLSAGQWRSIAIGFLALLFITTCWSYAQYFKDAAFINESYLRAKAMPTALDNDHVRYSWLVSVGILLICMLWKQTRGWVRWLAVALLIWFVVYLHVLVARTGLFSFYILVFCFIARFFFSGEWKWLAVLLVFLVALPLAAMKFVPTFQNRFSYFIYDISHIQKDNYLPGANDGNRYLSVKAGADIISEHPFGVGAGDVMHVTDEWYARNVPGILETDKLYPSSEWLIYGIMAGWPGLLLFTIVMLIPLALNRIKQRFFWVILNLTTALSFLFDVGLEVQYGVYLYIFIILLFWKWLALPPAEEIEP